MDRRSKIILGLFVAVLLGIIITEVVRPKPLNWKPSYTSFDKIPFGCYVLFNELPNLFPESDVQLVNESAYSFLVEKDTEEKTNYIFINNGIELDEQETNQLLQFVDRGNSVFMASTNFGNYLSDTLNLNVQSDYTVKEDSLQITLSNPKFRGQEFSYTRGQNKTRFTSVDTLNTVVLGHMVYTSEDLHNGGETIIKKPNFIQAKFGQGHFYLHTTPQAFTNYYMLRGNQEYVADVFSYLDNHSLLWDNYEKTGRVVIDSPMRFVLNQASLKWAYYLSVTGLLVFVIFRAKREQRIIPVIEPLENSSVEFARTIGGLYYQHKDYTDLISKKLNFFLEYVRSHYYLDLTAINEKTAKDLASKSGKSFTETKELLDFIAYLKNKKSHSEQNMVQLNKKITSFKK